MTEERVWIEVTDTFRYSGETIEKGNVVDLPSSVAKSVIDKGYGKRTEKEVPEIAKPEKTEETSKELDVADYMKSAGGWLTADNVEEGDAVTITGPGEIDESTFDRPYLNIPVKHRGSEYKLRLGKRNTQRISDKLGTKTKDWVGKEIQVVSIEDYPQLSSKGMILKATESE